jgi:lactate dehydrogenase-like 2-hydroxyacid dehydrogenase
MLTDDVADMAMGLLISASRGVSLGDRYVRTGKWGKEAFPPGLRVSGKRVGIFGLGRIGKAIARRAAGFDMDVGYATRSAVPGVPWKRFSTILELAAWCDFLVLAAPGLPETTGVVDDKVLAALGPQGVFINIARGSLVKEAALVDALSTGKIRAAGLDVFWSEPKVPEALLGMDNVALTPHQGSSLETKGKMAEILVKIVDDHFAAVTASHV